MRSTEARVAFVVALLGQASSARADAHPEVSIDSSQCADMSAAALERVAKIELGDLWIAAPTSRTTVVRVACHDLQATLRVEDPITGKSLERSVDLATTPVDTRPRLVALAIVELVSASWTELVANPQPKVAPIAPPIAPEIRREAASVAREKLPSLQTEHLRVLATFDVEGFPSARAPLAGAGVLVARDLTPWLSFALDVRALHGSAGTKLGRVDIDSVGAAGLAALGVQHGIVSLRGAVGARVAFGRLSGAPADSATEGGVVAGGFWGPLARIWIDFTLARWIVLEAALEGGAIALPVRGRTTGDGAVALEGGWIGGSLGAGVTF